MVDARSQSQSPSPGGRRQRAPTITIDTSAVSNMTPPQNMEDDAVALKVLPNSPTNSQGEVSSPTNVPEAESGTLRQPQPKSSHSRQASGISIQQLRASGSFDSRDSRPTSPHNVSSPTSRGGEKPHGFLAVPGLPTRQNSVESDDLSHAKTDYSGETCTNSTFGGDRDVMDQDKSNTEIMNDPEALLPDPGTEEDFVVEDDRFAFTPGQLNKLLNPKSLSAFHAVGGLAGLEKGLRTDRKSGLSLDETTLSGTVSYDEATSRPSLANGVGAKGTIDQVDSKPSTATTTGPNAQRNQAFVDRRRVFQDNRLPVKKGKNIFQLMWITYNDKVLILLSIAAVVSLGVGLYQTFGTKHDAEHPPIEWVEGVAIIIAIVVVVVVGSLNDFQKERQFVKLNKKKQDRDVNVIRSGATREISIFDILVGDVLHLEPGDMIPVDGIFIDGHNVKCDESQTTGESDLLRKTPADHVFSAIENHDSLRKLDPFILSGAQVTEGYGTFLVTSTGVNSSYGKTLMSLREDPEVTPLQSKLNTLAEYIAKIGGAAGLLLFTVLFIEFLARLSKNTGTTTEKGQQFLNIFIVTVTIIVVAVPEGLPLAVTLALAFATTRMLKDNNLVRHLKACEVMGNATTICSDKTGTLTQNKMMVVAGTIGTSSRFGGVTKTADQTGQSLPNSKGKQSQPAAVSDLISPGEVAASLSEEVKTMLLQSIAINSTAFEGEVEGQQSFIGSKTETALLIFARDILSMGPVDQERSKANITQLFPFDSTRKCMGVAIPLPNGKFRLYVKGASEILLEKCTTIIRDPTKEPTTSPMTEENRQTLMGLIDNYASRSLRTIAMVYRDFDRWPPRGARVVEEKSTDVMFEDIYKQMCLLGIVGIQDPLREGVAEAVLACQKAGVMVRMVTGDNMLTAKAIAEACGIFTPGGIIMEGPAFRKLSKTRMDQVIPRLQVLARSSPKDKQILVKRLKELGETVAVTGDGTNDAPALKTADVGFSMGIAGTEVAKEASAIILMDDNFNSIVKAMMWGRAVNDAVRKFLQFQVTVNITAVLLTFISSVSSDSEESVLKAVQLLWVNLIMDTMAALALATDPPTQSILERKPNPKSAHLISTTMWKMIIGEAIYQLTVTLILYFAAASIFNYDTGHEIDQIPTLVFNTFVWMQIFNQWNNRRLDNKFNIFEGMLRNWFFIGINIVMVGGQVMIIFVGGKAFNVVPLDGAQWATSLVLGALSIPVGVIIRLIPDELVSRLFPDYLKRRPRGPELTISDEEEHFRFPKPLVDVKEELSFLKKIKGGRLNNLKFAVKHPRETFMPRSRSGSHSRSNSIPQTPTGSYREDGFGTPQAPPRTPESRKRSRSNRSRSNSALGATTVMAGIIAGSVAGWSPINEQSYADEGGIPFSRAQGRTELEGTEDVEIHPGTSASDPIITENPTHLAAPPSQTEEVSPEPAHSNDLPDLSQPHPKSSES